MEILPGRKSLNFLSRVNSAGKGSRWFRNMLADVGCLFGYVWFVFSFLGVLHSKCYNPVGSGSMKDTDFGNNIFH